MTGPGPHDAGFRADAHDNSQQPFNTGSGAQNNYNNSNFYTGAKSDDRTVTLAFDHGGTPLKCSPNQESVRLSGYVNNHDNFPRSLRLVCPEWPGDLVKVEPSQLSVPPNQHMSFKVALRCSATTPSSGKKKIVVFAVDTRDPMRSYVSENSVDIKVTGKPGIELKPETEDLLPLGGIHELRFRLHNTGNERRVGTLHRSTTDTDTGIRVAGFKNDSTRREPPEKLRFNLEPGASAGPFTAILEINSRKPQEREVSVTIGVDYQSGNSSSSTDSLCLELRQQGSFTAAQESFEESMRKLRNFLARPLTTRVGVAISAIVVALIAGFLLNSGGGSDTPASAQTKPAPAPPSAPASSASSPRPTSTANLFETMPCSENSSIAFLATFKDPPADTLLEFMVTNENERLEALRLPATQQARVHASRFRQACPAAVTAHTQMAIDDPDATNWVFIWYGPQPSGTDICGSLHKIAKSWECYQRPTK